MKNKRNFIAQALALILMLCMLFSGCAAPTVSRENAEGTGSGQGHKETNRPIENVKSEYVIGSREILIETQTDGNAPRFDLYDQETDKLFNLPTMPEFVTLEEIVNENYIIFRSTGENSETNAKSVPKLLKCFRTEETDPAFECVTEEIRFDLTDELSIGTEKPAAECSIMTAVGLRDLQIAFESKAENPIMAGGPPTVPSTSISYEKDKNALAVKIDKADTADCEFLGADALIHNPYIEDCEIHNNGDSFEVLIYLSDGADGYYLDLSTGEIPSVSISFE